MGPLHAMCVFWHSDVASCASYSKKGKRREERGKRRAKKWISYRYESSGRPFELEIPCLGFSRLVNQKSRRFTFLLWTGRPAILALAFPSLIYILSDTSNARAPKISFRFKHSPNQYENAPAPTSTATTLFTGRARVGSNFGWSGPALIGSRAKPSNLSESQLARPCLRRLLAWYIKHVFIYYKIKEDKRRTARVQPSRLSLVVFLLHSFFSTPETMDSDQS